MAGVDDERRFREALLQHMQDVSQRLTALDRQWETPRGFQIGEGSGTSHHLPKHDATQHMASRTPTRPTMPTFLDEDIGARAQREPEIDPDQVDAYIAEYLARGPAIRDLISFRDYVQLQRDSRPHNFHRGNRRSHDGGLQRTVDRFHLPTFDGSSRRSEKAWVDKLDTSFQLDRVSERETIKMVTSHLEDEGTQDCRESEVTPSVTQDSPSLETSLAMSVDVVVEKVEPTSVEPSIEVMTRVASESSGGSSPQMGAVSGDVSTFDEALGGTKVLDDGLRQWYHRLWMNLRVLKGKATSIR